MSILKKIVIKKLERIREREKVISMEELKEKTLLEEKPRDLSRALASPGISLIAEYKRGSPSQGLFPHSSPSEMARIYQEGGARAISILTEEDFFFGSYQDLVMAKKEVHLPILNKDFFLTPYQVYEARFYGADAILLIARILEDEELKDLYSLARELGLQVLLEVHDEEDLMRVRKILSPPIVGINNRNLKTFTVDLMTTVRLMESLPQGSLVVSESGIKTREDVLLLQEKGVSAILVGGTLMKSASVFQTISWLLGGD